MTVPQVSIVLPVHNQADHLHPLLSHYITVLDRLPFPYELILVANACTDRSPEIVRDLSRRSPQIRGIETERKGWGSSVKLGLRETRGEWVAYTNLARTRAEDLLLAILYAFCNPGQVVKASRKVRLGWSRRLGSFVYNLECRLLFGLLHGDVNGTPKVFPRSCGKLLELQREDDLIDLEFNVVCRREKYPLVEIPIFASRRFGGKSTTNLNSAYRMYAGAVQMWLQSKSG
ncbi:MAG: glycosyltransferase [Candidatus Omnitrophica bacterium]|nr:glycosyltransferase [Candidatus Omnitrophota bacterium]